MAPPEWQDREKLWNAVEEAEKTKDSRLAREFVAALPIELSRQQQIELLQDFTAEEYAAIQVAKQRHKSMSLPTRKRKQEQEW